MTENQFRVLGFEYKDSKTSHLTTPNPENINETFKFTLFLTSQVNRWALRGVLIFGEYDERVRQLSYIDSESLLNFVDLGLDDDGIPVFQEIIINFMQETLISKMRQKQIRDN